MTDAFAGKENGCRSSDSEFYMGCGTAGRCRHRPLRKRILWCVGEGLCPSRGRPQGSPLRKGYKRCGEGKNPPVTASPCQPPLGKGAIKDGGRIATTSDIGHWFRNDILQEVHRAGRCRHRPLRKRNKRCNGRATARVAPTDALLMVRRGPRAGVPVFGLDRLARRSIIEAERALRQAVGPGKILRF